MEFSNERYETLRDIFKNQRLPLAFVDLEGAGEVQTPLVLAKDSPQLNLGDPIFFQHAKASELCERFNELILIQGGKIVDAMKTYRGEGFAFL